MSQTKDIGLELQKRQADLRENGLLADVGEKWTHPSGHLSLDALPKVFEVERRQRSDRLTNGEAARLGLAKEPQEEQARPRQAVNLHTWIEVGPAPSRGDGSRVRLRCQACGSMTELRARHVAKGWLKPCLRCTNDTHTQKEK